MSPRKTIVTILVLAGLGVLFIAQPVQAAEVRVAVAANFAACLQELAPVFAQKTGHEVVLIVGSTGKHQAQILAGAPFDVFLAADRKRPEALIEEGLALKESARVYARGRLVLWVAKPPADAGADLKTLLTRDRTNKLALANPRLAPYGLAARQTLEKLELYDAMAGRLVMGTSVGQTWQYAATGNVELALVAWSQVQDQPAENLFLVPALFHEPIEQMAVQLLSARHPEAAAAFLDFLAGAEARPIIEKFGYLVPGAGP